MRVKELKGLAFFLNSVSRDMKASQWKTLCKAAKKRTLFTTPFVFPVFTDRVTLGEAQGLSAEIARDLSYRDKNPDAPIASLLGSLNRLKLKTVYGCRPLRLYGKPRPGQVILKAGKNRFVPVIYPEAKTPKELLYVTLGAALIDGTLDRLKACLFCKKWTVGKNAGRKFCSDKCKDAFHYEARVRSGYFKDYQQGLRAAKKNAAHRERLKNLDT